MKKLNTLFVHAISSQQVQAVFALVQLLYKLQIVQFGEVVDARPHVFLMGAT